MYEDEVCDVSQTHITDLNNIDYNEHLFSIDNCLYNYKLSMYSNYNNDICECAYYLPEELRAKIKRSPGIYVVHIN